MISGKRVIAAMLTALMAVTFTANTAVSVYATGVTATENAQTIDAQSTDAQALTPEEQKAQELQQVYDMPVESNGYKDWPQGPGTYGEAGIVMEVGTGAILYAKNIDAHEYPASITKVLTALVALENGQLTDNVTFSHDSVAFLQRGDSSVGLKEGNVITLDQAMHAMLLASANEAAYAIGEGEAIKITTPDGGDRFDGNTHPHYHVVCTCCNRVFDLHIDEAHINTTNKLAEEHFDGTIDSHATLFYGTCQDCLTQKTSRES